MLHTVWAALAAASLASTLWQWLAARRFPLHRVLPPPTQSPGVTLLKPLKGADAFTEANLRSWLEQEYAGPVQVLFGVADPDDPAAAVVRRLLAQFPDRDASLVVCPERIGANAKVAQLVQLEARAKHGLLVVSDADVFAPSHLLNSLVALLEGADGGACGATNEPSPVGLVTCFYRMAEARTAPMRWEAVAVNADFWSQVLQGLSFRELDFALGAVMALRREDLQAIGGFRSLADYLADDFQLGQRIARSGRRVVLSPVVVESRSSPCGWRQVWRHQLRWARTIRVCQPLLYGLSLFGNATLWPLVWAVSGLARLCGGTSGMAGGNGPGDCLAEMALICAPAFWLARVLCARDLQGRLTLYRPRWTEAAWPLLKDLLSVGLWVAAFAGNRLEWRGEWYRVRRDGTLQRLGAAHEQPGPDQETP